MKKHKHPRKIHRHTPKVHKAKEPEGKFRWIEDLRNVHKGEEIWVLGCGPSLDDFPDGFFDDKIAIAVKWSVIAFPNCTYNLASLCSSRIMEYIKAHQLDLRKYIISVRKKETHAGQRRTRPVEAIYMKTCSRNVGEEYYKNIPQLIMNGIPVCYSCTNTVVHWALQAAIIMGAKKVTGVGCEARFRKFQAHALKHGIDQIYGRQKNAPAEGWQPAFLKAETPPQQDWLNGTRWLARAFKPYGIEVARYFYGKGYEEVIK